MEEEQQILKSWVSKGTTEHRLVERARIALAHPFEWTNKFCIRGILNNLTMIYAIKY